MKHRIKNAGLILALVLGLIASGAVCAYCEDDPGLKGWEEGGEYDSHYNLSEYDKFKGTVEEIGEVVPMPGMAAGVLVRVRDRDDELVDVHMGPKSFVDLSTIGLRAGDNVKVKGAWAYIDGKDVFMASKIKKGEYTEVKVRLTKNGKPFWSMTSEQLARERSQAPGG
jgi:hypothetical protein